MTKFISAAEAAKLVRASLKEAFPKVKFSVRSSTYSGGSSISVSWVDGPTTRQVDSVVKVFEGSSFDGMQDLKTNNACYLDGEKCYFPDWVQTSRKCSVAMLQRAVDFTCKKYGITNKPTVGTSTYDGSGYIVRDSAASAYPSNGNGRYDVADLCNINASMRTTFAAPLPSKTALRTAAPQEVVVPTNVVVLADRRVIN